MPNIIRKGDKTDHGGLVLEGFEHTNFNGRPVAGVGHMVSCPMCKGIFAIAEGSGAFNIGGGSHCAAGDEDHLRSQPHRKQSERCCRLLKRRIGSPGRKLDTRCGGVEFRGPRT